MNNLTCRTLVGSELILVLEPRRGQYLLDNAQVLRMISEEVRSWSSAGQRVDTLEILHASRNIRWLNEPNC